MVLRSISRTTTALVAAGLLFSIASSVTRGRTGDSPSAGWTVLGPGGGGTTKSPAISPHDARDRERR
jgi:hypothetical protein